MELSILHAIQSLHNPILDQIMTGVFNNLVGSLGQLWLIVGLVLLIIPKTRKCSDLIISGFFSDRKRVVKGSDRETTPMCSR